MRGLVHDDGKAEIHEFGGMRVRKKDVARLDVPMDEIMFERGLEPFGDLDADLEHLDSAKRC